MKPARGIFWREAKQRGTQVRPINGTKERGDWWIRYTCALKHLHRQKIGPRELAHSRYYEKRKLVKSESHCPNLEPSAGPILFKTAAQEHVEWAKLNKSSWKSDQTRLRNLIPLIGNKTLLQITPSEIEKIKMVLSESYEKATVNRYLACLKTLFSRALRDQKVKYNPVSSIPLYQENNARVRWITLEEEQKLFEIIPEPYFSLCKVALNTGLRKSELLGLTWSDIDFANSVITVQRSKNGYIKRIPMSSFAQSLIRKIPKHITQEQIFYNCKEISHWFKRWTVTTGIENLHFHDLRHTFASRLAMQGESILTIKDLMGHKSIQMTLRYSHLSPDHKFKAVERLAVGL